MSETGPETGIDRRAQLEAQAPLRGFHLYARPGAGPRAGLVAPAVAETPAPDHGQWPAATDTVTRLERSIAMQARAVAQLEAAARAQRADVAAAQQPAPNGDLLELLREALRHERAALQEHRALRAETDSLRAERDALALALREAEALSLTDELTSLPNRRAFMQRLDQELSRCQRTSQPLALVLVDIDHFKSINDGYGHYVGDMILRQYAQGMVRGLRQHDLLARYGGEEFGLLLPETLAADACNAMEKLARRLRGEPLEIGGTMLDLPSFSAGIACLRAGESATTLINRADQALYRAKRLGRSRVELEEQILSLPTPEP